MVVAYQGPYFAMDLFRLAVNTQKGILPAAFARGNYWGIIRVDFDEMGQLLIIYFEFVRYLKKKQKGLQCIEFKEARDLVRWEVLYNILIEFGIPMKW